MKRALLFVASFVIITMASAQTNKKNDKIIYRSFPKMEEKVCFEMKRFSKTDTNFFIALSPVNGNVDRPSTTEYSAAVVPFSDAPPSVIEIVKKSNRLVSACGKLIPVYFDHLDQIFTEAHKAGEDNFRVISWYGHSIGILDFVNQTVN